MKYKNNIWLNWWIKLSVLIIFINIILISISLAYARPTHLVPETPLSLGEYNAKQAGEYQLCALILCKNKGKCNADLVKNRVIIERIGSKIRYKNKLTICVIEYLNIKEKIYLYNQVGAIKLIKFIEKKVNI